MAQIFSNDARTTLASSLAPGSFVIPVVDASSFPTLTGGDYALITLEQAGQIEIIRLVAPGKSTNTLIVDPAGRAQEGTTALSFAVGARCEGRITAGSLYNIVNTSGADVTAETAARTAADTTLQNNINAEALARAIADTNESNTRSAADALKAPLNSPTFTGVPNAPTAAPGTNTLQLATTAFVAASISSVPGSIGAEAATRAAADVTLQNNINSEASTRASAVAAKADLAGNAGQIFSVANSAVSTQQAVPRAQADALYASITNAGIGYGQAWVNCLSPAIRALNITYTNSTSKPIWVALATNGDRVFVNLTIAGIQVGRASQDFGGGNDLNTAYGMVPPGVSYVGSGTGGLYLWAELR
jgi:hypothetical protein